MTKKTKFIVFTIILAVLVYLSIGYTYEHYNMTISQIDISDTSRVLVDGTDFSYAVMLMGYGINGFVNFLNSVSYAMIILGASLIFIIPFSLICINQKKGVTKEEYRSYRNIYILLQFAYHFLGV